MEQRRHTDTHGQTDLDKADADANRADTHPNADWPHANPADTHPNADWTHANPADTHPNADGNGHGN